ncbi:hypothetical protein AK830_g6016 [Neonectria ditissima]|uniref:Alcohol acetyltransferase n=1 Tax=Neonectria ditissima TaxID=78410 RepID=A0A0P7BJM6_9HYPO|nr:hypothetical protein AK830_g6016 [Neonectria ditissima]
MADIHQLPRLRPLGKLEQVSASCHHLGFFNNVGLSAHYTLSESYAELDLRRLVFAAVGDVLRKHRILFAIPVDEDTPGAYFASLPSIDLSRSVKFVLLRDGAGGEDSQLDAILEDQHNTDFKAEYGTLPFWRLIILQKPGINEFTASLIYHHAIGDGVAGLAFHTAFRDALDTGSASPDCKIEETIFPDENSSILPPLGELHPLPINPTPSPAAILTEWTGTSIHTPCKSRWTSLRLSPATSKAFFQECKSHNQSVTSTLSSLIATTLFVILPPTVEALTCIIPVSLRPWLKLPREVAEGAIGTYFDATRVQLTRADPSSSSTVWPGAERVSRSIGDYLANVSPSGEPYTAVAVLENVPDVAAIFSSILGKPRDAAFEVTNVGLFPAATENAPLWQVGKVLLSRSAVVSGAAVTVSVATGGNGSMAIGFSWQEGVLGDGVVDGVVEGVREFFDKF